MNYGTIEDSVLRRMFYEGATKEDFISEANESASLLAAGQIHYRHHVERQCCAQYVDSEEFGRETELYSNLVNIFKPLEEENIVSFFWVEFIDDNVHVKIVYDVDYEESHEDLPQYIEAAFGDIIKTVQQALLC